MAPTPKVGDWMNWIWQQNMSALELQSLTSANIAEYTLLHSNQHIPGHLEPRAYKNVQKRVEQQNSSYDNVEATYMLNQSINLH